VKSKVLSCDDIVEVVALKGMMEAKDAGNRDSGTFQIPQ
jgi:hypothetical protein